MNVYSVKGGKIPFDGGSLQGDFFTSDCKLCSTSAPLTSIDVVCLYIQVVTLVTAT